MSGIYDVTLAPGAAGRLDVVGNYAKVFSAPGGLVTLRNNAGESFALMEGQGFWMRPGESFNDITVVNKASIAQTVLVFISDGRLDDSRITGNVRVIDEIATSVVTVGVAPPLGIAANVSTQIVAPAANLLGLILRSISIGAQAGAGGTVNLRVIASPIAPAAPTGSHYTVVILGTNGANYSEQSLFDLKKRIPAGWGLYALSTTTVAAALINGVNASYETQ